MTETHSLDVFTGDTPIARELKAFLKRGGSMHEAVLFVAALERAAGVKNQGKQRASKSESRGSRLSPDWYPNEREIEFGLQRGLSKECTAVEAEKFRNYWTAKAGAGAIKRDWSATWRNWIISAVERVNVPSFHTRPRRSQSEAVLAGMGRLARRFDAGRVPKVDFRREIQDGANAADSLPFRPTPTKRD